MQNDRLPLSSWLRSSSSQWTTLYAKPRSKGSQRIHLTFHYGITFSTNITITSNSHYDTPYGAQRNSPSPNSRPTLQEIHRRSSILCTAVFQQGGSEPINSLAWQEPLHQQFLKQCSCYLVATPACKWWLGWFKTWAITATSDKIQFLAGQCSHENHFNFRGKRLPDGTFISSLSAEYPSTLAAAILVDIITPWVSQSSIFNQSLSTWRSLVAQHPFLQPPPAAPTAPETPALPSGQYLKQTTFLKKSENDGHHGFSNLTFISSSPMPVLKIRQIHSFVMTICCLPEMNYNSASLITTLIRPFHLSNFSDWIGSTTQIIRRL